MVPSPCYVAPRYFVGLDRVRETNSEQLVRDALRDHEQGKKNTRAEFINAQPNPLSRHACERHRGYVKFFFDHDDVLETADFRDPDAGFLASRRADVISEAADILRTGAGAPDGTFQIHVAQRHGRTSPRNFKVGSRGTR